MKSFPGYIQPKIIFQSSTSIIYRAVRERDNLPVVLKTMIDEFPTEPQIIRYKQEFDISKKLSSIQGVIQIYELAKLKRSYFLVLEDIGGVSVAQALKTRTFSVEQTLVLGTNIASILSEIHNLSVIHKDINPSNIIFNEESGEVRLIDFGISTLLSHENMELKNPRILEGTLPYISPEQTGRMNRKVDYRTDFYSLGATLYEMLTGTPPFLAGSPLEYLHCHIAKLPVPPMEKNEQIPKPVSDVVMKLLAKTAEHRYKSSFGIRHDLNVCLNMFQNGDRIESFQIGSKDVSNKIIIPEKLYGRKIEIEKLLQGFDRVSAGQTELVLVSGRSGIGKTALVKEIYRPLTSKGGFFISGKFDQLQAHKPYSAIIVALEQLVKELLLEEEKRLEDWRNKILIAIGNNGQLLIEIIPDLEHIIGKQQRLPTLPPTETENRFNLTLTKFIEVFAKREHPLVIFIDDLQWADTSSLRFLRLLMTTHIDYSLYLMCSYRDNEVSETHPLMSCIREIKLSDQRVEHIELTPLESQHVNELVSDALSCDPDDTFPLSELIRSKTAGNPFFVCEFLDALTTNGLVRFDIQKGKWHSNLGEIEKEAITDNVVDLLAEKLRRFGPETRQIVEVAACLGNKFELDDLVLYFKQSPKEILRRMMPAISSGSLIPVGDSYKSVEHLSGEETKKSEAYFKFAHDRIQQAAYTLIDEKTREHVHLILGKLLLQHASPDLDERKLFDITNHLNIAVRIIDSKELTIALADLNLRAGTKAKLSAAFDLSLNYFQNGIRLIEKFGWKENYSLMLELAEEAAESALLCTDFDLMNHIATEIEQNAVSDMDKAGACRILIEGFTAQHRPVDAVQTGLHFLRRFGIYFSESPNKLQVVLGLLKAKLALKKYGVGNLVNLPEMLNREQYIPIVLMRHMATPAYYSNPYLMVLLIFTQVRMIIRHGNSNWSASIFASFGLSLCGVIGDIENGYELGEIALKLLEKYPNTKQQCRTRFVVNTFVKHWKDHLDTTLEPLERAYQLGLETGDLEWGCLAAHLYCEYSFFLGKNLRELEKTMSVYSKHIGQLKQISQYNYNEIFRQVVLNLLGQNEDPRKLSGSAIVDEEMLPLLTSNNDNIGVFAIYLLNILTHFLYRDFDKAVEYAELAEPRVNSIPGMFAVTRFYFLDSLVRLAIYEKSSGALKRKLKKKVKKNLAKLSKWATFAPQNHKHAYYLALAEYKRICGRLWEASEYYDVAIELAEDNGFLSDECIALETTANFYLALGQQKKGNYYLEQAQYAYSRWGAESKVLHLEEYYGKRMRPATPKSSADTLSMTATSFESTSAYGKNTMFDYLSLIQASQGISGELILEDLLDKLMHILIENAGATRGFLILNREDGLRIEAKLDLEVDGKTLVQPEFISDSDQLSEAIVRYVSRTCLPIILGNAIEEESFAKDPYVMSQRPKSILCSPIMRHRALLGVVYLENNQTLDAFPSDRVEVVGVLSAQAAISIDNAELYTKLQKNAVLLQEALTAAENHSQAKSEFLAKTSHELRTPLNSIINIPEALLDNFYQEEVRICKACDGMFEPDSGEEITADTPCPKCQQTGVLQRHTLTEYDGPLSEVESNLAVVYKSSNHLLGIVDDILDISLIEAGRSQFNPEVIHVGDVLSGVIETVSPLAAKREIDIMLPQITDDLLIYADPVRLKQILINLMTNAIKFSPEKEKIELKVDQTVNDSLILSVKDNGIGISEENHEMIFESFRQVEGHNTRRYGGAGLGLAITKSLVEMHGGHIRVESALGKGSNFTVEIPINGNEVGAFRQ